MHTLRRIAKENGRAVVIVSHDQRIRDIADRVLWLEDGEFAEAVEHGKRRNVRELNPTFRSKKAPTSSRRPT
jgi:ABC-type lipoprotein export system ATPase subunit